MGQAIERTYPIATEIVVPVKRPPGIAPRQWRLAALYPRCQTAWEACERAGFSPVTARAMSRRALMSVGVERATRAIAEAQRDSAREVKRKAGARVNRELDTETADPTFALSAWATASKIAAEYPDEQELVDANARSQSRAWVLKLCRIAARVAVYRALRTQHLVLSPAIDDAAK